MAEVGDLHLRTVIEGRADRLDGFEIGEPVETDDPTGTTVTVDSFLEPPPGLQGDAAVNKLTTTFALALEAYGIELVYDGSPLEPKTKQTNRADYVLEIPPELGEASLEVIEWSMQVERLLYLCDQNGTPLGESKPQIAAPGFDFTAYLRWSKFADYTSILDLADMGSPELQPVMELAKDRLRQHFKLRQPEITKRVIEDWKKDEAYPYEGEPQGVVEQAERDLFDVVALTASKTVNSTSDKKSKRLSLRLMRQALETDPGALREVFGKVLELPKDQMEELSMLLRRTTLTAIVTAARSITNRLSFLKALEILVFDADSKAQLKERSQLHRILAAETWIFGEEYALAADDESLNTLLKKHVSILGREELADGSEVVDHEGKRRIVDLMLARTMEQAHNRREHVVIELKAPAVKIGPKELQQIKTYAFAIVADERFDKTDVRWDFVLVSNELDAYAEMERNQSDREDGLLWHDERTRIWVKTWAEIIAECDHRLKYVRKALDFAPTQDAAIEYLRQTHQKYLPDVLQGDTTGAAHVP